MIHDAKLEVTCDRDGCQGSVIIEPNYVYYDYSGKNGGYDCSEDAIEEKLEREGWSVVEGKHLCDSCTEDDAEQKESQVSA